MAVCNNNLLRLLLAYSASHRARFLRYKEPTTRIAEWVDGIFENLKCALDLAHAGGQISDADLATYIMLASLEIISPNAFGFIVPWQSHLTNAKKMIIARGGYHALSREDKVESFLGRWFTYLDVLGNLSGSNYDYDRPLGDTSESFDSISDDKRDLEIDCFLGFTTFCIRILARVADLAKQCDGQRVTSSGDIDTSWRPPPHIAEEAQSLREKLEAPRDLVFRGCSHQPRSPIDTAYDDSNSNTDKEANEGRRDSNKADKSEMVAINEAFHHAGLIHLHRRVLNKPSTSAEVQSAVTGVIEALARISDGGTAEACMIFPMFSAGCEAQTREQQDTVLARMRSVEELGMAQGRKARVLMQSVWETGRTWETLVAGEFFG